jgi:hypothetical protein
MGDPNETQYCRIDVPGAGLTIRLRRSFLERLAADVRDVASGGRESGGILLGSVTGKTLVVEDHDPLPSRYQVDSRWYLHSDVDRARMASALTLWSPAGESRLRVIGFYRSNLRPTLIAGEEERQQFSRELGEAASLLLLIQPGANGAKLACYLAEREQPSNGEGQLEIDLTTPEAPGHAQPTPDAVAPCKAKPERRERFSSGLSRIAAVPFAAGLLCVGFLQYRILKSVSEMASTVRRPSALGLEVQPVGPFWRVNWNRSSECLTGATRGHLRIEDGTVRRDLDLNAAELRNTSIIYDPAGGDLWFHLEVFGAQGRRSTAESLRVFTVVPQAASVEPAPALRVIPPSSLNMGGLVKAHAE